jgi:hypothetical protein
VTFVLTPAQQVLKMRIEAMDFQELRNRVIFLEGLYESATGKSAP